MKNTQSPSCLHKVRTLFVSGLPLDIKPRELYLLFRPFKVCLYVLNGWTAAIFSSFFLPAVNGTSINGDEINCSGNSPPRFECLVFPEPRVSHASRACHRNQTGWLYRRQKECFLQVCACRCCEGLRFFHGAAALPRVMGPSRDICQCTKKELFRPFKDQSLHLVKSELIERQTERFI